MLGTVLALGASACDGCDGPEGRVPQRDTTPSTQQPTDEASSAFEAAVARPFPEGTTRVAVEGAPLGVASGSIRALLPLDLNGDGDRDALFVRVDGGGASVELARRESDAFQAIQSLGDLIAPADGCTVADPALRTVSPTFAVVSVTRTCQAANGAGGDRPTERTLGILGLGDEPRLLERVSLLPEEGLAPGEVTLALSATDVDGDGHTDVVLEVSVRAGGDEPARVRLPWLDRPGGLARDRAEPEKTLAEQAERAREQLKDDAAAALALARQVLALHGVLCREGGAPRLRFGDSDGLSCGRSAGAGRAAAVAAGALAEQGAYIEALDAEGRIDRPGYAVGKTDRRALAQAWSRAPTPEGLRWRKLASHRPGAMPDVHLPPVGFFDDDSLLLRGASPQVVQIGSGEARPAPDASGPGLLRDPSGELAVVAVGRTCEGHVLSIVRAGDVVAGVVAGRPVAEPLLEARPPPPGVRCPPLPAPLTEDDGGWHILGWAPQGIVAVRGDTLRVVPLTMEGQAAGEPTDLAPGTPPPAPLPLGQATPDGRVYVLPSPRGILLRHTNTPARTFLLRPEGWKDGTTPSAVAISHDGKRVVALLGSDVWLMEGLP
jgi:hypothetical protein